MKDASRFSQAEPAPIDIDDMSHALFDAMTNVANQVSRRRMAIRQEDVEGIRLARQRALATINQHFDDMERTAEARRANLSKFSTTAFVSVGYDCFPRTVLTRWGLKPTGKLGELSHPFDLAIHPTKAVLRLLKQDFAGHIENVRFDPKEDCCFRDDLGLEFIHDKGVRFAENEFAFLKERYSLRAENFRKAVSDKNLVAFVHHTEGKEAQYDDVMEVFDLLRSQRGNYPSRYIWIHTPPHEAESPAATVQSSNDTLRIEMPYPTDKYRWSLPKHALAAAGVRFEGQIISLVESFVLPNGLDLN